MTKGISLCDYNSSGGGCEKKDLMRQKNFHMRFEIPTGHVANSCTIKTQSQTKHLILSGLLTNTKYNIIAHTHVHQSPWLLLLSWHLYMIFRLCPRTNISFFEHFMLTWRHKKELFVGHSSSDYLGPSILILRLFRDEFPKKKTHLIDLIWVFISYGSKCHA